MSKVYAGLFSALIIIIGSLTAGTAVAEDKGVQAALDFPIEKVKKAAADALTVIGCEIKKDESDYLEGYRAHKIGAFVGSGGETVSVKLAAVADGKTSVDVRTKKSFLGMAGQKNWDQAVLDEMTKVLAKSDGAATSSAPASAVTSQ